MYVHMPSYFEYQVVLFHSKKFSFKLSTTLCSRILMLVCKCVCCRNNFVLKLCQKRFINFSQWTVRNNISNSQQQSFLEILVDGGGSGGKKVTNNFLLLHPHSVSWISHTTHTHTHTNVKVIKIRLGIQMFSYLISKLIFSFWFMERVCCQKVLLPFRFYNLGTS